MLEGETRDVSEGGMKSFDALDRWEKKIAILEINGDQRRRNRTGIRYVEGSCVVWKKRNEYLVVGGVSVRSRNGDPSRKGCVVNGQTTKASNN